MQLFILLNAIVLGVIITLVVQYGRAHLGNKQQKEVLPPDRTSHQGRSRPYSEAADDTTGRTKFPASAEQICFLSSGRSREYH